MAKKVKKDKHVYVDPVSGAVFEVVRVASQWGWCWFGQLLRPERFPSMSAAIKDIESHLPFYRRLDSASLLIAQSKARYAEHRAQTQWEQANLIVADYLEALSIPCIGLTRVEGYTLKLWAEDVGDVVVGLEQAGFVNVCLAQPDVSGHWLRFTLTDEQIALLGDSRVVVAA